MNSSIQLSYMIMFILSTSRDGCNISKTKWRKSQITRWITTQISIISLFQNNNSLINHNSINKKKQNKKKKKMKMMMKMKMMRIIMKNKKKTKMRKKKRKKKKRKMKMKMKKKKRKMKMKKMRIIMKKINRKKIEKKRKRRVNRVNLRMNNRSGNKNKSYQVIRTHKMKVTMRNYYLSLQTVHLFGSTIQHLQWNRKESMQQEY